jgi:hypothetical protein
MAMTAKILTQARLKSRLHYDPDTGIFTWLFMPREKFTCDRLWNARNARFSGKGAGCLDTTTGYFKTSIDGCLYYLHRLAYLYMEGSWPTDQIDHINQVRTDNRWTNLRPVTHQENLQNTKRRSDSTTGVTGVCWHKAARKWSAQITLGGKSKHLGLYETIELAAAARTAAQMEYGFHANHGQNMTPEVADNTIMQMISFDG